MEFVNPAERIDECVGIWNSCVSDGDVVFKPLDAGRFSSMFLEKKNYRQISVAAVNQDELVAFGFANTVQGAPVAYITYIAVGRGKTRRGLEIGRAHV